MSTINHDDTEIHDHDRGLTFDMRKLRSRRAALGAIAGIGIGTLAACQPSPPTTTTSGAPTTTASTSTTTVTSTASIPQETAGPYPGDGTNGPNALTETGIVRSDIRSSFGTASAVATGVPATIRYVVHKSGTPIVGAAVYTWHCDSQGRYSMYDRALLNENYLRGVQPTDSSGVASFTSIFPACYSGRWPHIHFEVYQNLASATSGRSAIRTSQIALPEATCRSVYAMSGYEQSAANINRVSLATDMVFSDGWTLETPTVTGSTSAGYTIELSFNV